MTNWIKSLVSTALITLLFLMMPATVEAADGRTCLVLSDGYVSEYAWGAYSEAGYPPSHPGHEWGSAASIVSNDSRSDTPVRGDTAKGSADMTGRTEGHLDEQARGDAVSLNILIAETPSGQSQRRVGP